jgi:uncharacterized phage protein (TIGR01671 family)
MEQTQFKFKAFVRGYMVNVVSIDFVNQYITWDDNQYDRCIPPNKCYEMESFDEIKLMQYTGLKDKAGVDIYEGDVLRFNPKDERFGDGYWQKYVVEIPKFFYTLEYLNDIDNTKDLEVIGNVFENNILTEKLK